jgi:hypothetical protein
MLGDAQISPDEARMTLDLMVDAARRSAPQTDPRGLRTRLVWAMNDAASDAYLARMRRERTAERQLAEVAAEGFARRASRALIAHVVRQAAKEINANPASIDPAIQRGEWLVRNRQWTTT